MQMSNSQTQVTNVAHIYNSKFYSCSILKAEEGKSNGNRIFCFAQYMKMLSFQHVVDINIMNEIYHYSCQAFETRCVWPR